MKKFLFISILITAFEVSFNEKLWNEINKIIKNLLEDDTRNSFEMENDDEWKKKLEEEIKKLLAIGKELSNYEREENRNLIFDENVLEMETKYYNNLLIEFIRNGREKKFKAISKEFDKLVHDRQGKQGNAANIIMENENWRGTEKEKDMKILVENLKFEIISGFKEKQFNKFANKNKENWDELKKLYIAEINKKMGNKIKKILKKQNKFAKKEETLKKIEESILNTKFSRFFEYEELAKKCHQLNSNLLQIIPKILMENLAKSEEYKELKMQIAKTIGNLRKIFGKMIEQKFPNEWKKNMFSELPDEIKLNPNLRQQWLQKEKKNKFDGVNKKRKMMDYFESKIRIYAGQILFAFYNLKEHFPSLFKIIDEKNEKTIEVEGIVTKIYEEIMKEPKRMEKRFWIWK